MIDETDSSTRLLETDLPAMGSVDVEQVWNTSPENDVLAKDTRPVLEVVLSTFSMALILFLSISGNIFVLVAIARERVLQNKTSIFIANLAIADLINAFLGMTTILVSCVYDRWIFGKVFCDIIGVALVVACVASVNTLGVIALDRYFAIVYPFQYAERMSTRRIVALLVWVWTQSLLFSLMPVIGWAEYIYIESEYLCSVDWSNEWSLTVTTVTMNMGIPMMLMTYCYAHIFRIASAHRKQMRAQHNVNESYAGGPGSRNRNAVLAFTKRAKQMQQDTKAATTLFIVMGTFLLCWLPHTATMICFAFPSCTSIPQGAYVFSTWFGMLNSACNPFIYCTTNKQFREAFKRTLDHILPTCWKNRRNRRVAPGKIASIPLGDVPDSQNSVARRSNRMNVTAATKDSIHSHSHTHVTSMVPKTDQLPEQ